MKLKYKHIVARVVPVLLYT